MVSGLQDPINCRPDLPTVVSDRIARVFNRSGATRAVLTFDISNLSRGFDMLVVFTD